MKIRCSTSLFELILLFAGFLSFAAGISSLNADVVIGDADSWGPNGLFCFRSNSVATNQTNYQIHLMRYVDGKIEPLFAKSIDPPGYSPICLSNGVVDVTADGIIRKFNLSGKNVFEMKPKDFEGASGLSGKVSNVCIFMTETLSDSENKGLLYHLYLVDVLGAKPVVKIKFNICQPLNIFLAAHEIIVVGQKDTLRFKIPNDCEDKWTE